MTGFTTIEKIECEASSYDALITYKHHVATATMKWDGTYEAKIYEFVDEPDEEFAEVECKLNEIGSAQNFSTNGNAIKWCIDEIDG